MGFYASMHIFIFTNIGQDTNVSHYSWAYYKESEWPTACQILLANNSELRVPDTIPSDTNTQLLPQEKPLQ